MIRLPLIDERVLRAWAGDATSQPLPLPLPPYGIPLMVQANEDGGQPDRVTVTFVDEGGTQHRLTTRCLWEHRIPLGWWTMLLRTPNGDAAPGDLRFAGPCETLPGLLALARGLRVVLGRRPEPAVGAPPWTAYNITASTTGRDYHEAIERQEVPKMSTGPIIPVTFEPLAEPGSWVGLGGWQDLQRPRGPGLPAERVGDDAWEIACRCPSCGLMVSWYHEEHLDPDGVVRPRRLVGLSTPMPAVAPEVLDAMPLRSIFVGGEGPQQSIEPPPKVLRVGTPMGFHPRGDRLEALARCARCSRAVGVLTCHVTLGVSPAPETSR